MPQMVKYKYGDHTHATGEVTDMHWQEIAHMTSRGRRDTSLTRVRLNVELQACTWAGLKAKIDALYSAYTQNDVKFGMVDSNGADTKYVLDPFNPNMMRGPYVTDITCPTASMEEMVIKREFVITLEAMFAAPESQIIFYDSKVTTIGTAIVPTWVMQPLANGAIRRYQVWNLAPQRIIQTGNSIGFDGYYELGMVPVLGSDFEHEDLRMIEYGKPRKIGLNDFFYYPMRWRFVFEAVTPQTIVPP